MKDCPSEALLLNFLSDNVSIDQSDRVATHLNICLQCQQVAAGLSDLSGVFSTSTVPPGEPHGLAATSANKTSTTDHGNAGDPWSHASLRLVLSPSERPEELGILESYRIVSILGEGSSGVVLEAIDTQLERKVAIKIPNDGMPASGLSTDAFLHEAQLAAALDHPNIVPVYGFGCVKECCYIVYKFVEGQTLSDHMRATEMTPLEAVRLVSPIAASLQHAHSRSVYHRDIKPQNILLDREGNPHLTDFGLAIHESGLAHEKGYVLGTLPYMPPEHIRGEGHRIDGRSDIYSLGLVLYEMLSGRRPFVADSRSAMTEQILSREPPPLQQFSSCIPPELNRICLRCLSKRMTDRYASAADLERDLNHFAANTDEVDSLNASNELSGRGDHAASVVPKGLRSFEAHDADYFLHLLPGPTDRDGLPDSIRFWKTRIEETDPDATFTVGVLYGPSGCGKSSLVKAGLLPRIAETVVVIYLEAVAEDTEQRLLAALRRKCNSAPQDLNLVETTAALRRESGASKILIILDQFEQWLHAGNGDELVRTLRQCDGARVQCLLLVRDDFLMALSRFMREIEVPLVEGMNSQPVDLFDLSHARKVLEAVLKPSNEDKECCELEESLVEVRVVFPACDDSAEVV